LKGKFVEVCSTVYSPS